MNLYAMNDDNALYDICISSSNEMVLNLEERGRRIILSRIATVDSKSRYDISLHAAPLGALFTHNGCNYLDAMLSAMNHLLT